MTNHRKYMLHRRQVIRGASAMGLGLLAGCKAPYVPKYDTDILVLGAGLSGLHAARLLESEGKDVLVVEGAERIGGRLHTLNHDGGHYTEGGGEQIGASYARILDTARELNVAVTPDAPRRLGTSYHYQDRLYGPEDWKVANAPAFATPFEGASPGTPLFVLAARDNTLTSAADWREAHFAAQDISAEDYLISQGIDAPARAIIEHTLNGNELSTYSMMNLYRTLYNFAQSRDMGPSLSVDKGAQTLPEAMAKSLARPVSMGWFISDIIVGPESVTVTDRTGRTLTAPHCICTLPFGALRQIKISAPLGAVQKNAIANLPYTQIFQLHFTVDSPFWTADDLPANMWSDGPLERVFINHDIEGRPQNYGRVWINGVGAMQMAAIPSADMQDILRTELSKLRSIKPENIHLLKVQNWTTQNAFAGGAYMHWAPGQIGRWARVMGAPAGRLSFAGEHLSFLHTGMEGAMESAENAAFSLLDI